jgi:uncharacterized protein (TIGR02996 family)
MASMSGSDPLQAFYLVMDENPGDRVTLLALADWYEEHDQPDAADCLRWAARHGHRPFRYGVNGGLTVSSAVWHDGWFWWSIDDPYHGRDWGHDDSCRLPPPVWNKLRHTFNYDPAVFKEYPTRRDAFEALIEIWPLIEAIELERTNREATR